MDEGKYQKLLAMEVSLIKRRIWLRGMLAGALLVLLLAGTVTAYFWLNRGKYLQVAASWVAGDLFYELFRYFPDGYVTNNKEKFVTTLDAFVNAAARDEITKYDLQQLAAALVSHIQDRRLTYKEVDEILMLMEIAARHGQNHSSATSASVAHHPYPRTAIFQWGGAPDEWYAKFDLVMTRNYDPAWGRRIKKLNPTVMLLPAKDWNRGDEIPGFQAAWFAVDSRGRRIPLYGEDSWFADFSDLCPPVRGRRYVDFLLDFLSKEIDHTVFAGVSTDGIYGREHLTYQLGPGRDIPDIDLDRNGQNDLDEPGKGKAWVIAHWQAGIDELLRKLRERLGSNQIILLNSGTVHGFGWEETNGMVSEHTAGIFDQNFFFTTYRTLMNRAHKPVVSLLNGNPEGRDPRKPSPSRNYFQHARFLLGVAMCFDWYFEYEDLESGEHYYNQYYDELAVKIGYPTSEVQRLRDHIWVRFFDEGAVIVNVTGGLAEVEDEDLQSLNGYNGPYYRFQGGQDPDCNNGQPFTAVQLKGHEFEAAGQATMIVGDAILLTRAPRTVVADLMLDDSHSSTSAGSRNAEFIGDWTPQCEDGFDFYTLRCAPWQDMYGFRTAAPGNGEARAIYRPGIGVSGDYEVFEWHGQYGKTAASAKEGENVPHHIRFAGGEKTVLVDQSRASGRWNSLGVYRFERGGEAAITITNKANGPVVADAFKLVYRGSRTNVSATAN